MNVYAISDLHLSATADKPMNIFGGNWDGHFEKIKGDWVSQVKDEDVVLIAGDISWAMKLEDALVDLRSLAGLPGKRYSSAVITITGGTESRAFVTARPTIALFSCRRTP